MRRPFFAAVLVIVAGCYRSHSSEPEPTDAGGRPDAALADAAVDSSPDASVDAGPPCGERGPHRLSVGATHSCFIDDACALWCWGTNDNGQLGRGDTVARSSPVRFGEGLWRAVEVFSSGDGEERTCAIRADGSLWCAGRRLDRIVENQTTPTLWHGGPWAELSLTDTFNGIQADGTLWAFGQNFRGAVGRGGMDWSCGLDPYVAAFEEIGDGTGWSHLSGRFLGGCALRSGELWCWGANADGELGLGDSERRCEPTRVGDSRRWERTSYGMVNCGIRTGNLLYCAGANLHGQLDPLNDATTVATMTEVYPGSAIRSVSSGSHLSCAVTTNLQLWCWGSNQHGLLGAGFPDGSRQGPANLGAGIEWVYVDVDPFSTAVCAVTTLGELYCFGENANGQVGVGDTDPRTAPTMVLLP